MNRAKRSKMYLTYQNFYFVYIINSSVCRFYSKHVWERNVIVIILCGWVYQNTSPKSVEVWRNLATIKMNISTQDRQWTTFLTCVKTSTISDCLLVYDIKQYKMFQREILPPSSGWRCVWRGFNCVIQADLQILLSFWPLEAENK
jgi:hypothetical protein